MSTVDYERAPEPYDGYIGLRKDGAYEVAASGVVVGIVADRTDALALLQEHCVDRPRWEVRRSDDRAVRLD